MNTCETLTNPSRSQLRQQLRQLRRSLSKQQQQNASAQLCRLFTQHSLLIGVQRIAIYLANDGEIDPWLLMHTALKRHIACYLPVLAPNNKLWFVQYKSGDQLSKNRFGILEPAKHKPRCKSSALDMVLMPLVAFDRKGGRLGMGGGFYDRSFSWIKQRPRMRKPKIIGLAHHGQEVGSLELENWDIPVSYIATDKGLIKAELS